MSACALPGCGKPLPPAARREGDLYCSTACCKTAHGVSLAGSAAPMGRPKAYAPKRRAKRAA